MKGQLSKMNLKRKCPVCGKKRIPRLFPKGKRQCGLCDIAKAHGKKLERREASSRTWIKRLDSLVGARVRSRGMCEAVGRPHKGRLQWCHVISRSYHNTRWLEYNSLCLCAGCHTYFTHRPLEWEQLIIERMGARHYGDLKTLALRHEKIDYKSKYEQLKEQDEIEGTR